MQNLSGLERIGSANLAEIKIFIKWLLLNKKFFRTFLFIGKKIIYLLCISSLSDTKTKPLAIVIKTTYNKCTGLGGSTRRLHQDPKELNRPSLGSGGGSTGRGGGRRRRDMR